MQLYGFPRECGFPREYNNIMSFAHKIKLKQKRFLEHMAVTQTNPIKAYQ